jgi:hypothetical protein
VKLSHKIQLLTLFTCLLTSLQPLSASVSPKVLLIAKGFIGTKEEGNNGGYWVRRFQASTKSPKGAQWCASFVNFCLDSAGVKGLPFTGSGLARHFATRNKTIKATKVIAENMTLPPGTIIVWRRGTTPFGHAGIVDTWKGKTGTTVEGNTSSGLRGSQHDGDGVWARTRVINPTSYFRITDFVIY